MTYSLEFDRRALKEWNKLGDTLRQQFKKKLSEVLANPRIEANRLRQLPDCYKLKLRSAGYLLSESASVKSYTKMHRTESVICLLTNSISCSTATTNQERLVAVPLRQFPLTDN